MQRWTGNLTRSRPIRGAAALAVVTAMSWAGFAAEPDPLSPWKGDVKVSPVVNGEHHSIHTYFNTSPESPDGKWVVYYTSTMHNANEGDVRIRERETGREHVLATGVAVEDAHRAACQQWVSDGRRIVYHDVLDDGQWVIMSAEIPNGKPKELARGWQLGFGQPHGDIVPLYGPHWDAQAHRDLAMLNVRSGKLYRTALTAAAVRSRYSEWVEKMFGDRSISIFFPILSPDMNRIFVKIATPAGGDFRSSKASDRYGLICYDLKQSQFSFMHQRWGHPAWCPNSQQIIEYGGVLIDAATGKATKIPNFPKTSGAYHPSVSPDGRLFVLDSTAEKFGGPKGSWQIVVGDIATGESVVIHRFDHSQGARSWRKSHPHPVFSADGKRIYYNVSDGKWTRLFVAQASR